MTTKKEIKRSYKERLSEIKKKAAFDRRKAKRKFEFSLREYYQFNGKSTPINPPKRTLLEEIGNAVTHGIGSVFAIVALILMLISANTVEKTVSAIIYFVGLFVMFTMSCLYHSFKHGTAVKRLFRRFDYSSIYLLIGSTFAPSLLCVVGGTFGFVFFAIQWAIIIAGISLVGVFGPTKLRFVHIPMYVVLGWSALMLFPSLINSSFALAMWILGGGVIYTVGIIPFLIKIKGAHFIWHFFVLAGAVVQWIGIYNYIYLNG